MNILKTTDLYSWGNCMESKLCLNKAVNQKSDYVQFYLFGYSS